MTDAMNLPPRMQDLYDLLAGKEDVDINHLFTCYFGRKPKVEGSTIRYAQIHMSPPITRLNRRLRRFGQRVGPGRIKGTYRLTSS